MRLLLAVYCGSDRPTGVALEVLLDVESMLTERILVLRVRCHG